MIRNAKVLALVVLVALFAGAGAASAEPNCRAVHSILTLSILPKTACDSPIEFCGAGVLLGSIRAHSLFTGTSFEPTVDTGATGVVLLTGDNAIHTAEGDIYTKDAIVLALTGAGEFAEIDTVVGGTGAYAGATGKLIGTGTFLDGAGQGVLTGEICWN